MPARAQGLGPALRAGFRKPSGEEAAVSTPSVSGYGDSGCRCGADGRRQGRCGGDQCPQMSNMPALMPDEAPTSAVAGRRLGRGWTSGAAGPAPRPEGDGGDRRGRWPWPGS